MAFKRIRKRPMSEINVVPYIDVMLVMLVIFMITAPLLTQGVYVDLPRIQSDVIDSSQQEPLVVTVDAEGRYYINVGENPDQAVDRELLLQRSAAAMRSKPNVRVLVRGDSKVDYGSVVAVMALLQQAGAPNVGLITETPDIVPQ